MSGYGIRIELNLSDRDEFFLLTPNEDSMEHLAELRKQSETVPSTESAPMGQENVSPQLSHSQPKPANGIDDKYRKMLKMGIPRADVENKMRQDGLDPEDFASLFDDGASENKRGEPPADEKYEKYHKMLKMGLPQQAVENKMVQDGVDPAGLNPSPPSKPEPPAEQQQAGPEYDKYRKMLKMGLPPAAVELKITQDGLDPAVFNGGATTDGKPQTPKKKKKKDNVKRKKLFWQPLTSLPKTGDDATNINTPDSVWSDVPGAVSSSPLDMPAFNKLFTLKDEDPAAQKKIEKVEKPPQVAILDSRRAQNACIALSRIRFRYSEIRTKVATLDDASFSTTQLQALMEYSPTPDERMMIKTFTGDIASLGPAELFMLEMATLASPGSLLKVMLFKRQFNDRVDTLRESTSHIYAACDAVMRSHKLREVFHAIRMIGNAMNGSQYSGFALSSLSSLGNTRGFDKKTTVMRFLIQHLSSSELGKEALSFPDDLHVLADALQVSPKTVETDLNGLRDELKGIGMLVAREVQVIEKDSEREQLSPAIFTFLQSAGDILEEVRTQLVGAQESFRTLLTFLGIEDAGMSPADCFGPLNEFSVAFLEEKHRYDEAKEAEKRERRAKRQTI